MRYSNKVMEHFNKPKNLGRIAKPDGIGKVGNSQCGDLMFCYIRVKDNKITDVKIETFGCAAALACADVTAELAKGKTLEAAKKLTKQDIIKELGELPPIKLHCSLLGIEALKAAISDYENKSSKKKA